MLIKPLGLSLLLLTTAVAAQVAPIAPTQVLQAPVAPAAVPLPIFFYPSSGDHGTLVTLVGAGAAEATAVKLGDWSAAVESRGKNSVTIIVPSMPHGSAKFSVVTPRGTLTPPGIFNVSQIPIGSSTGRACTFASASPGAAMDVAAVAPESARSGEMINVLGSNLNRATSVSVGGVVLDLVSATPQLIVARVPNVGPPVSGLVQVRGPNEIVVSCATVDLLASAPSTVVALTREHPLRTVTMKSWGGRLEFDVPATITGIQIEGSHELYQGQRVPVWLLLFAPGGKASRFDYSPYSWTVDIGLGASTTWVRPHWVAKVVPYFDSHRITTGSFTVRAIFPPVAPPSGPAPPTGTVTTKQ